MNNVVSEFGLNSEQLQLLFSLQNYICLEDFSYETSQDLKKQKRAWWKEWRKASNDFLHSFNHDDPNSQRSILKSYKELKPLIEKVRSSIPNNSTPFYLILLECTLFIPYFPLGKEGKPLKIKYRVNENKETLYEIAELLKIDLCYVDQYLSGYKTAIKGITGFWPKVIGGALVGTVLFVITSGMLAPMIAAPFAAAGLSGAAATASGLATLGGGAIAAGGFGMAGGTAVIIGGGALLGATTGSFSGKLIASSPKFTINQAAKLEVVMREIALVAQKDVRMAQELILEQRKTLRAIEDQLFELQTHGEQNEKKIKALKKSIQYLKKAIDRNQQVIQ